MKYGDFSSLVQLGVGLHIGTALLQLYGEIGIKPLQRSIARLRSLFVSETERPSTAIEEQLNELESGFAIFQIRMFKEFKKYVAFNSAVAFVLIVMLTVIAFKAEDVMPYWLAVLTSALSWLPAVVTLGAFWWDASGEYKPLMEKADRLEDLALKARK